MLGLLCHEHCSGIRRTGSGTHWCPEKPGGFPEGHLNSVSPLQGKGKSGPNPGLLLTPRSHAHFPLPQQAMRFSLTPSWALGPSGAFVWMCRDGVRPQNISHPSLPNILLCPSPLAVSDIPGRGCQDDSQACRDFGVSEKRLLSPVPR